MNERDFNWSKIRKRLVYGWTTLTLLTSASYGSPFKEWVHHTKDFVIWFWDTESPLAKCPTYSSVADTEPFALYLFYMRISEQHRRVKDYARKDLESKGKGQWLTNRWTIIELFFILLDLAKFLFTFNRMVCEIKKKKIPQFSFFCHFVEFVCRRLW